MQFHAVSDLSSHVPCVRASSAWTAGFKTDFVTDLQTGQQAHTLQALAKLPQHVQTTTEGDESARRARKRERSNSEVVVDPRWSLKQKLAALTQDIELLTQEVR